jgi:hypothetical protein
VIECVVATSSVVVIVVSVVVDACDDAIEPVVDGVVDVDTSDVDACDTG